MRLEAIGLLRKQAAGHPERPGIAARAREMEGSYLMTRKKWSEALEADRQAVNGYREAVAKEPGNRDLKARLSSAYHGLARCWKALHKQEEALPATARRNGWIGPV